MKDKRYGIARNLIMTGYIKSFRELFEIIPKSTVAHDLRMNNIRFSQLMAHVDNFFLSDIFRMADLLEISEPEMVNLIYTQYQADKKKKSV